MNSLPAAYRGVGSGMNSTFQNSAQVFSIGIFFTLIIIGLSSTLSASLFHGLAANGVPLADAQRAAHLPPVSTLFAAFLGYNPVQHLVGAGTLASLPAHSQQVLLGHSFFPSLISAPFKHGLDAAFDFAVLACLVAAGTSWLRGGKYVHPTQADEDAADAAAIEAGTEDVPTAPEPVAAQ
jgi:hypothetical protein